MNTCQMSLSDYIYIQYSWTNNPLANRLLNNLKLKSIFFQLHLYQEIDRYDFYFWLQYLLGLFKYS